MNNFRKFVDWVFYGLLGYFVWSIDSNLREISKSVSTLNTQMAVQIAESHSNKATLNDHEQRIRVLESKQ